MAGIINGAWRALGGTSRKFRNLETGEEISRRQYDKRFGVLKAQGFTSYEQKAKATPAEIRNQRPAIGRPAKQRKTADQQIRGLRPLTEKSSRTVSMSFDVYLSPEGEIEAEAEPYRENYEDVVRAINGNSRISYVMLVISFGNGTVRTIETLTRPHSMLDFDDFNARLQAFYEEKMAYLLGDEGIETNEIIFHLAFKSEFIKPSQRKKDIKKSKQLKTKRDQAKSRRK